VAIKVLVGVKFRRFNPEPYGAPDDRGKHGPVRAFDLLSIDGDGTGPADSC